MALNIVEIDDSKPLGFGLDYRLNLNNLVYNQAATIQMYCRSIDISSVQSEPLDFIGMDYYFPTNTSGETLQISSSDAADNSQQILVYYYATNASTEPVIQAVTLNGQNAVTLGTDVYRISRLIVNPAFGMNAGNVYLSPDGTSLTAGVPDTNILCGIRPDVGFSEQSFMYVPPGWQGFLTQILINNNSTSAREIVFDVNRQITPTFSVLTQHLILNNGDFFYAETAAPAITGGSLYILRAQRISGSTANATVVYNFVLFR